MTIVGNFNIPLKTMDRSSKQQINKETMAMNDTLDQMDLTDIFRTFHPTTVEYTFFSTAYGTVSIIDYIRGHTLVITSTKSLKSYQVYFLTTMV